MFETRRDIRYFQALLVREIRAGRIEILAYSFMTTHYHLVLRSLTGELSHVMQYVLNLYVRFFNRARRRDGPLPRTPFGSRPVRSEAYFRVLVRYVDLNAPRARLVATPEVYPYGSAAHYVAPTRPRWLHTEEVDMRMGTPPSAERARRYRDVFGGPLSPAERGLVNARVTRAPSQQDALDSLLAAAPPAVLDWMRRKAKLADNTKPGEAYADAELILACVRATGSAQDPLLVLSPAGRRVDGWPTLVIGVLRDLAGLALVEVSLRIRSSASTVARRLEEHRRLILEDAGYAQSVAFLVRRALDLQWGVQTGCTEPGCTEPEQTAPLLQRPVA